MDSLNAVQVENLQRACRELGIPEERTILLDYEESFYYYVMTQKIETWNRSVGWYSFEQQKVSFRRMSMNSGQYFVKKANMGFHGRSKQGSKQRKMQNSIHLSRIHLVKNCIPVFRSMERDLTRNGHRNL